MSTFQESLDAAVASASDAAKAATSHTHSVADLTATGTRDATTFLRGDNTWATPAGGGVGGGLWTPPVVVAANAYCLTDPWRAATTTANAGDAGGRASGYPWSLDRQVTVDSVSVNNTSAGAAGTFSRFMIYSADANGRPGTLVWDSGQEAQDVTGVKTFTTSLTLAPGLYWTVSVRAAGAGAAAQYTAFNWGTVPWMDAAFSTASKSFDLGLLSSTATPPSTWTNTTYGPITRAPVALSLHVTGVA